MLIQPAARRHHRSRIAYTFGLLALMGAATTLVVVVRDPALSSTQLTTPVPAPEITVVEEGPNDEHDAEPDTFDDPFLFEGADEIGVGEDDSAAGVPDASEGRSADGTTRAAPHSAEDIRRSLFWSGLFGLAISLAGLGLVGTRRRMW